jgi:hypothetical protein
MLLVPALLPQANEVLRQKLNDGQLTAEDLYHQLLRLVYRFLFLFALEERRAENGLRLCSLLMFRWLGNGTCMRKGYSLDRLREVMLHRSSYNYYTDLWAARRLFSLPWQRVNPVWHYLLLAVCSPPVCVMTWMVRLSIMRHS